MKLDITIKEVLIHIQTEVKNKFGIEMSLQEIGVIYESQFQVSALAFKKGTNVRLPYFGSFIRKRKLNKFAKYKELQEEKPFIAPEVYEKKLLKLKLEQKALTSKARNDTNAFTSTQLKDVENIVDVANKFDKIYEG